MRTGRDTAAAGLGHLLVRMAVTGAGYYIAARLSLRFALIEENVTPFWPPTGIAVVGFLVWGARIWPAVAAAAFLVNLPISPSPLVAGVIAIGNCAAPVVAAWLLGRTGFRDDVARLRDAVSIVAVALAATLISASVGSAALAASGAIPAGALGQTWSVWWTGDAMGVLLFAPLLLMLRAVRPVVVSPARAAEAVLLLAALASGCWLLLRTAQPVWVLLFPLLGLIAWRFQRPGSAPAALLVSCAATWAAVKDLGAFATPDLLDKMFGLQVFNAAASLTALFVATLVAERTGVVRALEGGYQRQQRLADTLQRGLLPDRLQELPDVDFAACYVPSAEVTVGGDWYDAIVMPDGRVCVAIGDVAGHGTAAAATMGQLRMALRAYALDGDTPSRAIAKVNRMLLDLPGSEMATILVALLDPASGDLTYANAGHPPPLVVSSAGETSFLSGAHGPPVGVSRVASFAEASATIDRGSALVLYTDGLVERRASSIDDGLRRLASSLREPMSSAGEVCEAAQTLLDESLSDDTAVLVIRRTELATRLRLRRIASPSTVPEVRDTLTRWLGDHGVGASEAEPIVLAASEACTNVIVHAYGAREGTVRLEAEIVDGEVVVAVSDEGSWRDPVGPDDVRSGRGLDLIRGSMDTLDVQRLPGGTQVTMRKRLRAGKPADA